jgi:HlyD family secretion protein
MDREITQSVRNRRVVRRVWLLAAATGVVTFSVASTLSWLRPSVRRRDIVTARVSRGTIDVSLTATGMVVPDLESVISSPIEARVLAIRRQAGDRLRAGDDIVTLDTSATRLDVDRLNDRVAQKESEVSQLRLKVEENVAGIEAQIEQKRLDLDINRFKADQNRKLLSEGLVARTEDLATATAAKKSEMELSQLADALGRTRRTGTAQLSAAELELRTLRKEREESRRQLELAMTRSDRDGVLTWIVPEVGATIRRGDVLARVADLSSFRVVATVSDVHASSLSTGMPARVRIDDNTTIDGSISNVDPRIENGVMTFRVALDPAGRTNPKLRNNLRVDVFAVTGRRSGVFTVRRGSLLDGEHGVVFVVRGDMAVRVPVRLGAIGEDSVEIAGGLKEGDEVVISNMTDYSGVKEVRLK